MGKEAVLKSLMDIKEKAFWFIFLLTLMGWRWRHVLLQQTKMKENKSGRCLRWLRWRQESQDGRLGNRRESRQIKDMIPIRWGIFWKAKAFDRKFQEKRMQAKDRDGQSAWKLQDFKPKELFRGCRENFAVWLSDGKDCQDVSMLFSPWLSVLCGCSDYWDRFFT